MGQLEEFWARKCLSCDMVKPVRTHHCSICQRCVFLMDHHCPWVNNCLGLENYRYFLLFVFYLMLGCGYMVITIISIWHHHSFKKNKSMMSFITVLDIVLGIVMMGFTGWNWFLAFQGNTTIEFQQYWNPLKKDGNSQKKVNFSSWGDNLYRVFGT